MKQYLLLILTIILFGSCKKNDAENKAGTPVVSAEAKTVIAKLIGTWHSSSTITIYYDKANKKLHEASYNSEYYWIFRQGDATFPSTLGTYDGSLNSVPDSYYYDITVEKGLNYIDFYQYQIEKGTKHKIVFNGDDIITVTTQGLGPPSYNIGGTLYTADHFEKLTVFKKMK